MLAKLGYTFLDACSFSDLKYLCCWKCIVWLKRIGSLVFTIRLKGKGSFQADNVFFLKTINIGAQEILVTERQKSKKYSFPLCI